MLSFHGTFFVLAREGGGRKFWITLYVVFRFKDVVVIKKPFLLNSILLLLLRYSTSNFTYIMLHMTMF